MPTISELTTSLAAARNDVDAKRVKLVKATEDYEAAQVTRDDLEQQLAAAVEAEVQAKS